MNTAQFRRSMILRTLGLAGIASVAFAQAPGTWTGVQILEPSMLSASPPEPPIVASDADGHTVSVWTSPSMGVAFTERFPGGTWSTVNSILPGTDGYAPQVAIGPTGMVAASWVVPGQEFIPTKLVVSVRPVGGSFGVPTVIATGATLYDSRLGISKYGVVTIAFAQSGILKSAVRDRTGAWSPVQVLTAPGTSAGTPEMAVNPNGSTVVVWQQGQVGVPGSSSITAVYKQPRSLTVWDAPETISLATGLGLYMPKVGMDAVGNVAVTFIEGSAMMIATKKLASTWSVPLPITPATDNVYSTAMAMDARGNVLAAWQALDVSNYGTVSKRAVSSAGPMGPVVVLSTSQEDASAPTVSLAFDGSIGIVTWVDNNTFTANAALGGLRGPFTVYGIGSGWWNTPMPTAAGASAVSVVWNAPTPNPNVTRMVANAYRP